MSTHFETPKKKNALGEAPSPGFQVEKSQLTDQQLGLFCQRRLTGVLEDDDIPHVGVATINALKRAGVKNTFQLYGRLLMFRNKDDSMKDHAGKFFDWLKELDNPKIRHNSVIAAMLGKLITGFTVPINNQEGLKSRLSNADKLEFREKPLTGDPVKDIKGFGQQSAKKAAANGITSTWQLFGKLLESQDAGQFVTWLKDVEVASGYTGQITELLTLRLQAGLSFPGVAELLIKEYPTLATTLSKHIAPPEVLRAQDSTKEKTHTADIAPPEVLRAKDSTKEKPKEGGMQAFLVAFFIVLLAFFYFRGR